MVLTAYMKLNYINRSSLVAESFSKILENQRKQNGRLDNRERSDDLYMKSSLGKVKVLS